jgi:recombination protein RecT
MTDTPPTKALTVREYFTQPSVFSRFEEVMGNREAAGYITQVGIAVANNKKLQACTNQSIFISSMRAAALRLSVDPATGEAHLVPFGKDNPTATLIIGYKGLMKMALRTNKYRYINVGRVYEGEEVTTDRMSGFISIHGGPTSKKTIGLFAAFELVAGYAHSIYMTIEEIHAHGKKFSKSYDHPDGLWRLNPEAMERKTVLRILLTQWGYFEPGDAAAIQNDEEPIEADFAPVEEDAQQGQKLAEKTESELLHDLGF